MKQNSPLQVIVCLLLLVSWNAFAQAQPAKVKVGYSAISEVDLPAWIAKETRIFEKNGLDVQLIYFTGGTTGGLALVSGEVPISQVKGRRREQPPGGVRGRPGCRRRDLTGVFAPGRASDPKTAAAPR